MLVATTRNRHFGSTTVKVLIADKFSETHIQQLTELGHEVSLQATLAGEALQAAVPGFDVLVVRSTRVDAATIDAATSLSLIIRAGAGVNTIDVDRAAEQAIFVCNTPGKNAVAVAELVMGLILSIDRHIPDQVAELVFQNNGLLRLRSVPNKTSEISSPSSFVGNS